MAGPHDLPEAAVAVEWRWTASTPSAPTRVRAALGRGLVELGYDAESIDDALLIASELVANATQHGLGPYRMTLYSTPGGAVCAVEDRDPRIPPVPEHSTASAFEPVDEARGGGLDALCAMLLERGRGLHIVNELTRGKWGFQSSDGKKIAWASLPISSES
ncbi:ATP-binding protein [Streptomyces sp. NPDC050560]|uniref:ATP-binding protein n=1 Tax=Streptomyces sp. NPDC050560 TaxID=3365630 RepID=UPI0037A30C20